MQTQRENYLFLVELQKEMLMVLKAGATAKDVYNHALEFVRSKKPNLEAHMLKNLGFGVGSSSP